LLQYCCVNCVINPFSHSKYWCLFAVRQIGLSYSYLIIQTNSAVTPCNDHISTWLLIKVLNIQHVSIPMYFFPKRLLLFWTICFIWYIATVCCTVCDITNMPARLRRPKWPTYPCCQGHVAPTRVVAKTVFNVTSCRLQQRNKIIRIVDFVLRKCLRPFRIALSFVTDGRCGNQAKTHLHGRLYARTCHCYAHIHHLSLSVHIQSSRSEHSTFGVTALSVL